MTLDEALAEVERLRSDLSDARRERDYELGERARLLLAIEALGDLQVDGKDLQHGDEDDRQFLARIGGDIQRLASERAGVVAALDELHAPSVEDLAAERGPEYGTLRERVNWFGEAIGVRDAEIERLRRLTKQRANDKDQLRREINMLIEGLFNSDARAAEAHAALDAAGVPRERDGLALALAERIAAALPPLPEPAGEWRTDPAGTAFRQRRLSSCERIVAVAGDPEDWHLIVRVPGEIEQSLTRAAVAQRIGVYRLALGPAGIPPTTEPKP